MKMIDLSRNALKVNKKKDESVDINDPDFSSNLITTRELHERLYRQSNKRDNSCIVFRLESELSFSSLNEAN